MSFQKLQIDPYKFLKYVNRSLKKMWIGLLIYLLF